MKMITLTESAKRKGRHRNSKIRRCVSAFNSKNPLLEDIPFIKADKETNYANKNNSGHTA